MSAHKHTPGPWEQADSFGASPTGTAVKAASDNYLVASCTGYYGREGAVANARLIAAAPEYFDGTADLLAYEEAVEAGDDERAMLLYASAIRKLRAAQAKATGESA